MLIVLLNIPAVQSYIGQKISYALSDKLGTKVLVGNVDLGMLNRIIIDDVLINDLSNKEMLNAPRISAKVKLRDLIKGKITISSAQLFGVKANLYKKSEQDDFNFQFILDSLASKDTTEQKPLNLEISSLIIRRGELSYNQLNDKNVNKISTKHINLSNISAHIILNKLTNDSLDINIKRVSLKDKSGLELKNLSAKVNAGNNNALLQNLYVELPKTKINIPEAIAHYKYKDKKLEASTLNYQCKIIDSHITPCDLASFTPLLKHYISTIVLSTNISGNTEYVSFENLSLTQGNDFLIQANASLIDFKNNKDWNIQLKNLRTNSEGIINTAAMLNKKNSLPKFINSIGKIELTGNANKQGNTSKLSAKLSTTLGSTDIKINKIGEYVNVDITAANVNIKELTNDNSLGTFTGKLSAKGKIKGDHIISASGNADIKNFTYKNHTFKDANAVVSYVKNGKGHTIIDINDRAGNINLIANYDLSTKQRSVNLSGRVDNFDPYLLDLTKKWEGKRFSFVVNGDLAGNDINSANGSLLIKDFAMKEHDGVYKINEIEIHKTANGKTNQLTFKSDFATLRAEGNFDYRTLVNSITNAVYNRLPTIPGIKKRPLTNNNFNIYATVNDSEWAQKLFGIDIQLVEPVHLIANINDKKNDVDIKLDALSFAYNGSDYRNGHLLLSCPNDTMQTVVNVSQISDNGDATYTLRAKAANNQLNTKLVFHTDHKKIIKGEFNATANFNTNDIGKPQADITILPSVIYVNDTIWNIDPAKIKYYANNLEVNKFAIHHDDQHIIVDGKATKDVNDEITVELKDVNVSYILGLVNFHSVEFAGYATGVAKGRSLFGTPEADAKLNVKNFTFEDGRLGTLNVKADWNITDGAINIDGLALDEGRRMTDIKGYVSPKNSNIDLHIKAKDTRLEFLNTFCDSFLNDIDVYGTGEVNVIGPFKAIQLIGKAKVEGSVGVNSLNTYYTLRGDSVYLYPNDIVFKNDSIYDRDGHLGIVNGHLRHENLSDFSYDINIGAQNLLTYDTHSFGEDTFYGTAYATGTCSIKGKSGEVVIDVDATPNAGSQIVYNAASPDAIADREFITWNDRNKNILTAEDDDFVEATKEKEMNTNLYLNLLIHCNNDATLKLLMDQASGDYISLNGNGVIRASYYNKGNFDMFGNYNVDYGIYKLTIQNVIKRDFEFLPGGTISFGGDAYNAALNLQAQYTVNGVSLSDINIGKSFSNNNIRVNCLMNISGTPYQPRVDFSLDMPTVSADAKQMIMSLMNSEQEMKQQVVYLLAVGRFLNQGTNNAYVSDVARQSQTSLAMQSILSGTLSQQLSSILENVVKSNNWNFGANISTGDEGLYNAEYEGLVSGRLLNNRLLVNGQFGYRDNPNATSSFIGDFDIRYLLVPSGNMAVKIYNQANDKYFTKNSLNTQGVGLIFKKDFNGWKDLFRFKKYEK